MPIRIMPGEVTPTLFVGLGGSGGRAIGRISRRLRAHPDFKLMYENLVRFVAIDTNDADLAKLRKGQQQYGKVDAAILISDFDKVKYAELRTGDSFAAEDEYFTQWLHDWYQFRAESGAGAGQIRVESRLSFFHAMEQGKIRTQVSGLLRDLKSHRHGMAKRGAPVQVFVYFSVAGGTGSGGFLPFAYFMRDLLDEDARLMGFAILPRAFEDVIGKNRDTVYANGYAALKELEYTMRLGAQAEPQKITLHYDPFDRSRRIVTERPYDVVYFIDRPSEFSVDDVGEALADATYLQIFSPILGDQAGDYDNYSKHSRALRPENLAAHGEGYTLFYGTLGASVLVLPRHALLRYCAKRYAANAVRRYLLLSDPAVVSGAAREKFKHFNIARDELEKMSTEGRARALDKSFRQKIDLLIEQDRQSEYGVWKRLADLPKQAHAKLEEEIKGFEERVKDSVTEQLSKLSGVAIDSDAWTPDAAVSKLEKQTPEARKVADAALARLKTSIELGDWWPRFFEAMGNLRPAEQRYLLILFRDDSGALLSGNAADVDEQQTELQRAEANAAIKKLKTNMDAQVQHLKATYGGMWDRVRGKDEDFDAAVAAAVKTFNDHVDAVRRQIVTRASYEMRQALGVAADGLRDRFRDIEIAAAPLADRLDDEAKVFERDGGGPDGEANQYALDVEVLQHPQSTFRLWSWYYVDQIQTSPEFTDATPILESINEAMKPRVDDQGRPRKATSAEIVSDIFSGLEEGAARLLEPRILGRSDAAEHSQERHGLRLDDALGLEAAYYGRYAEDPRRDAVDALPDRPLRPSKLWEEERVKEYAKEKILFAMAKAQPLTRVSAERADMLEHAMMMFVGRAPNLLQGPFDRCHEEAKIASGEEKVEDIEWGDPSRVVFYKSILGVAPYCFPNINNELKPPYDAFQAKRAGKDRAWPLHIDKNWDEDRLHNLDPVELRATVEAREAGRPVVALLLGLRAGVVVDNDGTFALKFKDREVPLGKGVTEAANGMTALRNSDTLRPVHTAVVKPLEDQTDTFASNVEAKQELKGLLTAWRERAAELALDGRNDEAKSLVAAADLVEPMLK